MGKRLRDDDVYLVRVDSERCDSCGEGVIECGKWKVEGGKGQPYDGERERGLQSWRGLSCHLCLCRCAGRAE